LGFLHHTSLSKIYPPFNAPKQHMAHSVLSPSVVGFQICDGRFNESTNCRKSSFWKLEFDGIWLIYRTNFNQTPLMSHWISIFVGWFDPLLSWFHPVHCQRKLCVHQWHPSSAPTLLHGVFLSLLLTYYKTASRSFPWFWLECRNSNLNPRDRICILIIYNTYVYIYTYIHKYII
jgi:hypothetical protein